MNIDNDTLRGPAAEPMPGSIAEGGHTKVRLTHPAGLARRNRVRTDIETLAVDVELSIGPYDVDETEDATFLLKKYVADVFGKDGWFLLDHSPIREQGDGRDYLGVKINVTDIEDTNTEEWEPAYFIIRTDEGQRTWVIGQFKDEERAKLLARDYVGDRPGATVSVVKFAPTTVVASYGMDQNEPATIFARCILGRNK